MIQRLLHIVKGNRYYALEVSDSTEGERFHLLELHKRKGELHLEKEETFLDLADVANQIKKHVPIVLVLNTSQVLLKTVPKTNQKTTSDVLQLAFPNLDREQFYHQSVSGNTADFIALTKKSVLENWLERLSEHKLHPYAFGLGPLAIDNLSDWVNDELRFSGYLASFENRGLNALDATNSNTDLESTEHEINGIQISSKGLLGFATILSDIKGTTIAGNTESIASGLTKNFFNQRFFSLGIQYGLFLCFALLLLNFLGWSYYTEKVNTFQDSQALNQEQLSKTKQLEKLVASKQEKLETLQRMGNTKSSWYFDQVAQLIPSSILLDRFEYHPLLNQVRPNKPIFLDKDKILIEGQARNEQDFLLWTRTLEDKSWVKGIFIDDYGKEPKSGIRFRISLEINNNG